MDEKILNFAELDSVILDALNEYHRLLQAAGYPAGARVCYERLRNFSPRIRFLARKFGHEFY